MEYKFLKEQYPQITDLYYDFVNGDVYANHPAVQFTERETSKALDEIVKVISEGDENTGTDILISCASTYEHSGFILGFTLAMNFIQESLADKVHAFAKANS